MDELLQTIELLTQDIGPGLIALSATFLHFFAEPTRWWYVITRHYQTPYATTLHVFNTTALMSYMLPFKMGLPVRHMLLKRTLQQSHYLIGSTLFLDTFFVYLIWTMASVATMLGIASSRPSEITLSTAAIIALIGVVAVVAIGAYRFRRAHLIARTKEAVAQLRGLMTASGFLFALGTVLVDLLAQGIKHWAILNVLGFEIGIVDAVGIAIVSITVGLLSFMPFGLGAYDVVLIALVSAASTVASPAWLVPIVSRGLSIFVAAILGSLGAARLGIRVRDRKWRRDVTAAE